MLLVIAVVGAVVLARKVKRAELIDDPLVAAARAEPRAGAGAGAGARARGGGRVMLAVAEVTPAWYLVLGSILFAIGAVGLLVRRNPLVMFMCVELMLNAVTLTFVTFSRMLAGRRRPDRGRLRARGGRRRGRGGPRHHRGPPPQAARRPPPTTSRS